MKLGRYECKPYPRRKTEDMKKMFRIALPWLVLALVLPVMAVVLFAAKPAEAG